MEDFFTLIGAIFVSLVLITLSALFGGTLVWLLWPIAIPALFPGLVTSGVLATSISWWPAVCFTWLCNLLIKSSITPTNKEN